MTIYTATGKDIPFYFNDGGRAAAGYKGHTGDCCTRAFAIAAEQSYQDIYDRINELAQRERKTQQKNKSNARTGVHRVTAKRLAEELGFTWNPLMQIGSGCTVHLNAEELPKTGRHVLSLSKHYSALIEGAIHDTHLDDRDGTRCVYGIWTKED